ncbi:anti-sigma factor domain-containing protein [Clostridium estertheticum]|uniref:Anti-sigma factor domain-containing protein n=1 Tax=Clostridium estertheticum TaxID=238834 RepID=A0AA47EGL3_9CLOT|nr:anti-sigma factor domain-containing protein [Clostridium estertheticum]MBU3156157.1 anti-sigma factor domain-containing protein [Clostridium estertheticum]WAG58596.1 anti-sigma factor domain-containing protein [Clostridium estertheticum]
MNKTGIVINIINKKAGIMTSSGEFLYIKISKVLPNIGEIYTGKLYKKNLFIYKYVISVASLMFVLVSSAYAHTYYTPVSTIILRINPSISIDANKWNKIINSKPLNSDGALILNNIKLKNKSIDVGLGLLVKEAKTENFINEKYVSDKKVINLDIKSTKTISIDISNFENTIGSNNLNVKINLSPGNTKNIDIIINNKKINTSTLNNNSYKRKITNNQSNINISENKSAEIKDTLKDNSKSTTKKYNKINNDIKTENKNSTSNSSSITKHENSNKIKNNVHTSKNKNIKNADLPSNTNIQKHSNKTQNRNSN